MLNSQISLYVNQNIVGLKPMHGKQGNVDVMDGSIVCLT